MVFVSPIHVSLSSLYVIFCFLPPKLPRWPSQDFCLLHAYCHFCYASQTSLLHTNLSINFQMTFSRVIGMYDIIVLLSDLPFWGSITSRSSLIASRKDMLTQFYLIVQCGSERLFVTMFPSLQESGHYCDVRLYSRNRFLIQILFHSTNPFCIIIFVIKGLFHIPGFPRLVQLLI